MFANIVGMHLSTKRKQGLALSERPDQIAAWVHWAVEAVVQCFSPPQPCLSCPKKPQVVGETDPKLF